jgi:hypothetical protein
LQGPEWLQRHVELLEELANARGAADLAPDVGDAEAVLHEQAVLVPEWGARWRERWRTSLAASATAHTVLLHVAALQARPHAHHRPSSAAGVIGSPPKVSNASTTL